MNRTRSLVLACAALAAPVALAQTTPAPTSPTADAPMKMPAGDPVKVAPNNYKALFENDKVRVFEVTFAPGETIAMHRHPDHVVYALSGGSLRITGGDGKASDATLEAGKALFMPAQEHAALNLSNNELKLVVVELKPGMKAAQAPAGDDLLKVGRKNYKMVLDHDRLRVLDVTFDPGDKIAMHAHPDHVIYVIRGGQLKITPKGEKAQTVDFATGAAMFGDAEAHVAENVGKSELKAVVFELR